MLTTANATRDNWDTIIAPATLVKLKSMQTLALDLNHTREGRIIHTEFLGHCSPWNAVADSLTSLELWNVYASSQDIVQFIQHFTQLRRLALTNVNLRSRHLGRPIIQQPLNVQHSAHESSTQWLSFLIELRRQIPLVMMELSRTPYIADTETIRESALRWIIHEAIPVGSKMDYERETRLLEDFESFLPLWDAEDSERGRSAAEARKDGKLVDAAMASRWRGLSRTRR
jgi:hypothetical protein